MSDSAQQAANARPSVRVYTRSDCHLCDDAKRVLAAHGLAFEIVDIDGNPQLRERFGMCVPVVEIDGRVRFRGHVDPVLLRRILMRST